MNHACNRSSIWQSDGIANDLMAHVKSVLCEVNMWVGVMALSQRKEEVRCRTEAL